MKKPIVMAMLVGILLAACEQPANEIQINSVSGTIPYSDIVVDMECYNINGFDVGATNTLDGDIQSQSQYSYSSTGAQCNAGETLYSTIKFRVKNEGDRSAGWEGGVAPQRQDGNGTLPDTVLSSKINMTITEVIPGTETPVLVVGDALKTIVFADDTSITHKIYIGTDSAGIPDGYPILLAIP
ncbi:MAG: hypothetical protein OEX03_05920 [Gammaproteobacteria bacterium]|nr:hypothetical protein [Gammaproteobacteria bacterium]